MDVFGAGALLTSGIGSGSITPSTGDWLRGLGNWPTAAVEQVPEPGPSGDLAEGEVEASAEKESGREREREEGEEGRASSDEGKENGAWVSVPYRA